MRAKIIRLQLETKYFKYARKHHNSTQLNSKSPAQSRCSPMGLESKTNTLPLSGTCWPGVETVGPLAFRSSGAIKLESKNDLPEPVGPTKLTTCTCYAKKMLTIVYVYTHPTETQKHHDMAREKIRTREIFKKNTFIIFSLEMSENKTHRNVGVGCCPQTPSPVLEVPFHQPRVFEIHSQHLFTTISIQASIQQ